MILQLFAIVVIISYAVWRWKARHMIAFSSNFKSNIKTVPILGQAHHFAKCKNDQDLWNVLKLFGEEALKQGGAICSWNLHRLYYLVADPVIADPIMKYCLEKDDSVKLTLTHVENGSFAADVPIWRPRRKALSATFNQKYLMHFEKIFSKQSLILINKLNEVAGTGSFSISKYLMAFTMDSVCGTTLGVEAHAQENHKGKLLNAFTTSYRLIAERITKPWLHFQPIYNLTKNSAEFDRCADTIFEFIVKAIKGKRKELGTEKKMLVHNEIEEEDKLKTFLELMIETTNCDDDVIKEEVVTIFAAGTDTSALSSSFTSLLLARHPEIQEKVHTELIEVFGDSKRAVVYEDLHRLKYLEAVIKESLRLYPPAPYLLRKVDEDVLLPSDLMLPKGTGVAISVYATHRNPTYWGDDAENFRPERFLEGPLKHPGAFMAFSTGPRNCIGYKYAMMSMKTVLATLLRHFRVLPISDKDLGQPVDVKFDIMLRAVDEFQVILQPRS